MLQFLFAGVQAKMGSAKCLRYNKCCFCLDNRTGALVIATLMIVLNVLGAIFEFSGYGAEIRLGQCPMQWIHPESLYGVRIGFISYSFLFIILSSSIIYGVRKENHLFLLPWLIIAMIFILVSFTNLHFTLC